MDSRSESASAFVMKGPASPSQGSESKANFATPDRDPTEMVVLPNSKDRSMDATPTANTVTPPESAARDHPKVEAHPEGSYVHDTSEKQGHSMQGDKHDTEAETESESSLPLGHSTVVSSSSSPGNKRGLVSRRGGRFGSPARPPPSLTTNDTGVLEFKTFRSPQRKTDTVLMENETIPSLCSTNSGLHSVSSHGPQNIAAQTDVTTSRAAEVKEEDSDADHRQESGSSVAGEADESQVRRPSSISCDSSMIDSTSPLASHDVDASPSLAVKRSSRIATRLAAINSATKVKVETEATSGKRIVTFSPPPPQSDPLRFDNKKTPTKSPSAGRFQNLPSLSDAKLSSPCGIFLSPYPSSPSVYATIAAVPSFEPSVNDGDEKDEESKQSGTEGQSEDRNKLFEEEKSSKARDLERERAVATPTDFVFDFGKGHHHSASFDASNVLAWLQSPTANGIIFSPGGLNSALNTPRGGLAAPRTPRTPTVSTSFFFSDVASLPRNSEFSSPKPDGGGPKRSGNGQQGAYSSMICISPLASSKRNSNGVNRTYPHRLGDSQTNTPMNFKDVFASPRAPSDSSQPRSLPLLGDSPSKGMKARTSSDGNLDAVHMAERDLMEDEDLSVLLQLASRSNTPRSVREGGHSGPHVFRSPRGRKGVEFHHSRSRYDNSSGPGLPGLQLPIIGGRTGEGGSKLSRKTSRGREDTSVNDFTPPPLSIRSSSSGGSKEIFLGDDVDRAGRLKNGADDDGSKMESKDANGEKRKTSGPHANPGAKNAGAKSSRMNMGHGNNTTYSIPGAHPPFPHGGGDPPVSYYPLPGSMPAMQQGGSMRVVVGCPPPMGNGGRAKSSSGNGNSPPRHRGGAGSPHHPHPYPMQQGQGDGSYPHPPPPPGSMPYPPPHGHNVYPHHPGHMGGMGVPPHYHGHYPPPHHHPSHLPMYGSQHPQGQNKTTIKAGPKKAKAIKPSKSPATKRPADAENKVVGSATKKPKKSSPPKSAQKKKSKSVTPSPGDPVDRQKAAEAIAAVNAASGGKNDRAAALAAAILRGVTMRPSGKWQAQLYYAGKSRYIGVFDTREKAALAYEIAREKLKSDNKSPADQSGQTLKATEAAVNSARKAAFEGVNEKDPRMTSIM